MQLRAVSMWSVKAAAYFATTLFVTVVGFAEVKAQSVDRMLAIVEGDVVTMGDVQEYRALAAFFNEADIPQDDIEVLNRVIERVLIRAQVARIPGIRATEQAVAEYLARFSLPEGIDFPLSSEVLRQAARDRIESGRYFTIRFPQEVTDPEIRDYYETVWVPEAEARGLTPVGSLDEVRDAVGVVVEIEKMQREATLWAETLVGRSKVEVVE